VKAAVSLGPSHARERARRIATSGSAAMNSLRTDAVPRHAMRLVVVGRGTAAPAITAFATLPQHLRAGDLVVVNDAATLPASLRGRVSRTPTPSFAGPSSIGEGEALELRLSGPVDNGRLVGVVLGAGDHRTPTERRPPPPALHVGDEVELGGNVFTATVAAVEGRRVVLATGLADDELWQRLYAAGRPVQYAHRRDPLPLYDVQTAYAARPWAAEMPSAGRGLTWDVLLGLRRAGVEIARLTHAAGLSSTGDAALDRALPWPERYDIPATTAAAIASAKASGRRIIAIGTTVVRALEASGGEAGPGVATLRLDANSRARVVDGLVSGLHVPGESHYDLLTAFTPEAVLHAAMARAAVAGLSSHELGDACLILRP
jgi:S-adenosylmethionine:tRNA ribosyltransferase-isomerase